MALDGGTAVRHYFHPAAAKPLKIAFYHFGGNTPGVDLKDVAAQTQAALRAQLFKHSVFREVAGETLGKELKRSNSNVSKLISKGWEHTRLQNLVDLVVLGSVSKDDKGYVIEAKFHAASGKLIYSQLIRADDRSDINSAAKEIASNVIDRFPFEGTVKCRAAVEALVEQWSRLQHFVGRPALHIEIMRPQAQHAFLQLIDLLDNLAPIDRPDLLYVATFQSAKLHVCSVVVGADDVEEETDAIRFDPLAVEGSLEIEMINVHAPLLQVVRRRDRCVDHIGLDPFAHRHQLRPGASLRTGKHRKLG